MIEKKGMAHWSGGLKDGKGEVTTESGALKAPYSFSRRFGDDKGTNPEELIAAAHSGCFAMALSGNLDEANMKADAIDVTATVMLDTSGEAPTVKKIHLKVTATIPGIDKARFDELAEKTKSTCPISRLLAAAEITMDASLV